MIAEIGHAAGRFPAEFMVHPVTGGQPAGILPFTSATQLGAAGGAPGTGAGTGAGDTDGADPPAATIVVAVGPTTVFVMPDSVTVDVQTGAAGPGAACCPHCVAFVAASYMACGIGIPIWLHFFWRLGSDWVA